MSSSNPRRIGVAFEVEEREVEGHEVEEREVEERKVEPMLLPKAGSEATGRLPEYGGPKLRSLDISVPFSSVLWTVRGEGGATGPLTSCRNRSTKRLASSRTFSGSTFLSASSHDGVIGGGGVVSTSGTRNPTTGTSTTGLMAGSAVGVRRTVGAGGAALGPPATPALSALAAGVVIARR